MTNNFILLNRKKANLTQSQLANKINIIIGKKKNIAKDLISKYETENKSPTFQHQYIIDKLLSIKNNNYIFNLLNNDKEKIRYILFLEIKSLYNDCNFEYYKEKIENKKIYQNKKNKTTFIFPKRYYFFKLFNENSIIKIGNIIKSHRVSLNLTQESLAKMLYVDKTTISNYERNINYPEPYILINLVLILSIFEFSIIELLLHHSFSDFKAFRIQNIEYQQNRIQKIIFKDNVFDSRDNGCSSISSIYLTQKEIIVFSDILSVFPNYSLFDFLNDFIIPKNINKIRNTR